MGRFKHWLVTKLLKVISPELFTGKPQPHEDQSLADGEAIKSLRKETVLAVERMRVFRDGDRIAFRFEDGGLFFIYWKTGLLIGELAQRINNEKSFENKLTGKGDTENV